MRNTRFFWFTPCKAILLFSPASIASAFEWEFEGQASIENRQFVHTIAEVSDSNPSVTSSLKWQGFNPDSFDQINIDIFSRKDFTDSARTKLDIREAMYIHIADQYEVHVGIGKVFWGVTESRHLVDTINQTDLIENIDFEQKLGQPMISVSTDQDWGTLQGWVLPYFRERTFASEEGRLSSKLTVLDKARYESSAEQKHVDVALRYSHVFDTIDFGIALFDGTQREPYLLPTPEGLQPFYAQMQQVSVDLQATQGAWLWKLEALHRSTREDYFASVAGFEYSITGVFGTNYNVGLISEYQYDSRKEKSTSFSQQDIFMGLRWVFNDIDGTEVILGTSQDVSGFGSSWTKLEASSRINNQLKWNLNMWYFSGDDLQDPITLLNEDDYAEFILTWYF
ncbi:hypothetical protein L1286_15710 [Pseudoalteromonas sp. SMS1]|uniref:hypothetical protein n=1 Tax=Pseudoalteromonas sp. SMS1 TaxID=2908894 RepID=UPI001F173AB4|nr:hypothetical protein [Pseudoalteromonas sp. SMS1]MCF2858933.1 hypothetical protein [Pseudoalteromonas sp. SMS1]